MRMPASRAVAAIAKSMIPAISRTATTRRSGGPNFAIRFHLSRYPRLNRRRLHLRIVIGWRFFRRLGLGDLVDRAHDYFVDGALAPILRSELAHLQRSFNENVVALFIQCRDFCEIAVENQAVPIRVLLGLVVPVGIA